MSYITEFTNDEITKVLKRVDGEDDVEIDRNESIVCHEMQELVNEHYDEFMNDTQGVCCDNCVDAFVTPTNIYGTIDNNEYVDSFAYYRCESCDEEFTLDIC